MSTEKITSSPVAPGTGTDDFAASRVPPDRLQSAWDISLVRMGLTVSASDLVFGYTVGLYFSFWQAIGISLLISLIVLVISVGMGAIGLRERLTFALSARFAFGREGSRLPSLVMTVIIAAFYGYILAVTADVFPDAKNGAVQVLYCLGLGVLMVAVSALGFSRGLKWIGRVGVPLMVVLVIVADAVTITHDHGFGAIVHARPALAGKISLAVILGAGIAKWTGGAAISADVMRFARSTRALFTSTAAEFLVGNFGFNLLGLILGLGLRSSDLGAALGLVGLTWLATVAFLVQGITVETNELYAASLASSNALGLSRRASNIAVGVIGVIIGYIGLSHGATASFLTFINYVSYALPAIPGIILADYFVSQPDALPHSPGGPRGGELARGDGLHRGGSAQPGDRPRPGRSGVADPSLVRLRHLHSGVDPAGGRRVARAADRVTRRIPPTISPRLSRGSRATCLRKGED